MELMLNKKLDNMEDLDLEHLSILTHLNLSNPIRFELFCVNKRLIAQAISLFDDLNFIQFL